LSTLVPRLRSPLHHHQLRIRSAQQPRRVGRAVEPVGPVLALEDHRHAVVHAGDVLAGLGHHHRVGRAAFGRVAPQAGDGERVLARKREPGARLGAFLALALGEGAERDQAAPLGEGIAPHEAVELVGAGVVDRFRFQRLTVLALEHQREALGHGAEFAVGHDEARAAGIDLAHAGVTDAADDRVEQVAVSWLGW